MNSLNFKNFARKRNPN